MLAAFFNAPGISPSEADYSHWLPFIGRTICCSRRDKYSQEGEKGVGNSTASSSFMDDGEYNLKCITAPSHCTKYVLRAHCPILQQNHLAKPSLYISEGIEQTRQYCFGSYLEIPFTTRKQSGLIRMGMFICLFVYCISLNESRAGVSNSQPVTHWPRPV